MTCPPTCLPGCATAVAPHGSLTRYKRGCRCDVCCATNAAHSRAYRQRKRYSGVPSDRDLVPADRAREHLRWLRRQGVGMQRAADLAGMGRSRHIFNIANGDVRRVLRATEVAILRVTVSGADDRARVDATLTWRRIHGLVALGYTQRWITEQLGYRGLQLPIRRTLVEVRNARRVADLVDQYGNTWGPSERAREYAKRQGWEVIGAWDDDLSELA